MSAATTAALGDVDRILAEELEMVNGLGQRRFVITELCGSLAITRRCQPDERPVRVVQDDAGWHVSYYDSLTATYQSVVATSPESAASHVRTVLSWQ